MAAAAAAEPNAARRDMLMASAWASMLSPPASLSSSWVHNVLVQLLLLLLLLLLLPRWCCCLRAAVQLGRRVGGEKVKARACSKRSSAGATTLLRPRISGVGVWGSFFDSFLDNNGRVPAEPDVGLLM